MGAPPASVYRRWPQEAGSWEAGTDLPSLACHVSQATHVQHLYISNTTGAAPVNAWRRTVALLIEGFNICFPSIQQVGLPKNDTIKTKTDPILQIYGGQRNFCKSVDTEIYSDI